MNKPGTHTLHQPPPGDGTGPCQHTGQPTFEAVFKAMNAAVLVHRSDGEIVSSNPAAQRLLGLSEEALLGRGLQDRHWRFFREDGSVMPVEEYPVAMAVADNRPVRDYVVGFRPEGSENINWALVHAQPIYDADGRLSFVVVTFVDISVRQRQKALLDETDQRFQQISEHIRDVFWIRNLDPNEMLFISKAYEDVFGLSREELLRDPKAFFKSVHPEDRDRVIAQYSNQAEPTVFFNDTYRIIDGNGGVRWIYARTWPVHDESGEVFRVVGVAEDVTENHEASVALREAKVRAERADRAKSEFLANASHELRTPINGVLGFMDLVLDSELTSEQKDNLGEARGATLRLLNLVNDLIEVSRLEADGPHLETQPFQINVVLKQVLQTLEPEARAKGLYLEVDIDPDTPEFLYGDPALISKILIKLGENAVKFTGEGGVTFGAAPMYIPDEEWFRLHLTVADTGIGIPDDKRDEIFGTLTQLDGSSTRRFGGLGLGLTLVFGLVRALDGMIWVENGSHSGSAFHVALPMSAYSGEDGSGSDT